MKWERKCRGSVFGIQLNPPNEISSIRLIRMNLKCYRILPAVFWIGLTQNVKRDIVIVVLYSWNFICSVLNLIAKVFSWIQFCVLKHALYSSLLLYLILDFPYPNAYLYSQFTFNRYDTEWTEERKTSFH